MTYVVVEQSHDAEDSDPAFEGPPVSVAKVSYGLHREIEGRIRDRGIPPTYMLLPPPLPQDRTLCRSVGPFPIGDEQYFWTFMPEDEAWWLNIVIDPATFDPSEGERSASDDEELAN